MNVLDGIISLSTAMVGGFSGFSAFDSHHKGYGTANGLFALISWKGRLSKDGPPSFTLYNKFLLA